MAYTREYDTLVHAGLIARALGDPIKARLASDGDRDAMVSASVRIDDPEAVTLLIDQSGSQEGGLGHVIPFVDLVATGLAASGVPFEVLGYTTTHFKANMASARWIADGRPSEPGRLTPLLHVVHKSFAETWASTATRGDPDPRTGFDRMLRRELMRENVDGEAVDWAAARLLAHPSPGRRLLVVSESSPVDGATMAVNGNHFLRIDLDRALQAAGKAGVAVTGVCTGTEADAALHYPDRIMLPEDGRAFEAALGLLRHIGLPFEETVEARFERLAGRWHAETAVQSSITRIRMHPAFREIVAMGEAAVPLIVGRIRDKPGHLSLALSEITGVNPVPEEHRGRNTDICADWVAWYDAMQSPEARSGP